ncbi:hypothetical protein BD324DRAFT_618118 [Kockovaella imperatae]|uniref:Uncharacterized protein n=1 Tax=Kockovaella imperatae TaxID=4999 RepID=A0A1Y1UNE9_9TREE|nr:hypothetical protein BD324DRAFT_618118 [Kockovaella imperatae]ORX38986.1 hypothetical protein BD324DRAFT_618118 [Kockovaella imperatae]
MPSRSQTLYTVSSASPTSSPSSSPIPLPVGSNVLSPRASSRQSSPFFEPSPGSPASLALSKQLSRGTTLSFGEDDLDAQGYLYSLRVAVLRQRLDAPSNSKRSVTPPIPSPPLLASSPEISSPPLGPAMNRRKSSFGLSKKKKDDEDSLKLPKEFLVEFWNVLEAENGNQGWKITTAAFLKQTKGTKTGSGMNLRYLPVLLDAFSQVAAAESQASSMPHEHQSHLLQLLYNFLPRSTFFSPLARSQTDKDKDLLFKLRTEVQAYLGNQDISRSTATTPTAGPSPRLGSETRGPRKAPPSHTADFVSLVGDVWGRSQETLTRDVLRMEESDSIEKTYLLDLKRELAVQPGPFGGLEKSRKQRASQQLTELLQKYPRLAAPGDPKNATVTSDTSPSFFVPVQKTQVLRRLVARASGRADELVEACRRIWIVPSRDELERELVTLHEQWRASLGGKREIELARLMAPVIKDLETELEGESSQAIRDLSDALYDLLAKAIESIFPITDIPPARPPASLLYLFAAGQDIFFNLGESILIDLSDQIKGAAVQEYVMVAQAMLSSTPVHEHQGVDHFAKVATWIEREVINVKKSWGSGLGDRLDPASIILAKQLPLFCAELQSLDKPSSSSEVFSLYDTVARLVDMWEDQCPGQEMGFELHHFFEPHIKAWLRETETLSIQEWVSRAIGMDDWRPDGHAKHSQSVTDLFQFIHASLRTIQEDLPLSDYRRNVYLIDLSKIISAAVTQYAATINAVFIADVTPAKISTPTTEFQAMLGGKAGSWLAKGQQAVKSLEKKKVDGFVAPPTACTKLMDITQSQVSLQDIISDQDISSKPNVKSLRVNGDATGRRAVTVTLMRGSGMLAKGSTKAADAFVVFSDKETGDRLLKTQTILGNENPRWNETVEITMGSAKILEFSAYNRSLVGKHDLIGSGTLKVDNETFVSTPVRDLLVTLTPQGSIRVRLDIEDGASNDANRYLSTAMRSLERTEVDMMREITDRIGETVQIVLSTGTLNNLAKQLKDKKRPKGALSDGEIEASLGSLFESLNANFAVFTQTLDTVTRIALMLDIWHRIIDTLISLLVPPYSDQPCPSRISPTPMEVDIIFKWLQMLKSFLNASDDAGEHGVPASQLQDQRYRDLLVLGQYLDLPNPALKERCSAAVKAALAAQGTEDRRKQELIETAEVLLRLARTRSDLGQFLAQQIGVLAQTRASR